MMKKGLNIICAILAVVFVAGVIGVISQKFDFEDLTDKGNVGKPVDTGNNSPNSSIDPTSACIVNFGDSIFGLYEGSSSVSGMMAEMTGAEVVNAGLGGTGLVAGEGGFSTFSMVKIADAVASKSIDAWDNLLKLAGATVAEDGTVTLPRTERVFLRTVYVVGGTRQGLVDQTTGQVIDPIDGTHYSEKDVDLTDTEVVTRDSSNNITAIDGAIGIPSYFASRLLELRSFDFDKVTHFTFNHGTNDWAREVKLDDGYAGYTDKTTYKDAMRYIINRLKVAYPDAEVVVIGLINRFDDDDPTIDGSGLFNDDGVCFEEFVEAGQTVAKECGVEYIRLYDTIDFTVETKQFYYGSNPIHPNIEGNRVIAAYIVGKLFTVT